MSVRKSLMGFVCVLAVTAMSSAAYAKTVYVSTNGKDSNNGSASSPFRTIERLPSPISTPAMS